VKTEIIVISVHLSYGSGLDNVGRNPYKKGYYDMKEINNYKLDNKKELN